jgi:hypothetical protein
MGGLGRRQHSRKKEKDPIPAQPKEVDDGGLLQRGD